MTNINQILEYCEISKKAINVIEQLNHFLKIEQDFEKFLQEFEARQLWRVIGKSLAITKLAAEIGGYHYPSKTLDELLQMDEKEALETLFMEPINHGKYNRFKQFKLNLVDIFTMKQQQPKMRYMEIFLYA